MSTLTKKTVRATKAKKVTNEAKDGKVTITKKPVVDKKELDTKNIKDTVKQVVESEREIKYKYPEEIDNQLDRKTWRQKTRNKLRAFERELAKLEDGKDKVKLNKEYIAFRKEVLLVP